MPAIQLIRYRPRVPTDLPYVLRLDILGSLRWQWWAVGFLYLAAALSIVTGVVLPGDDGAEFLWGGIALGGAQTALLVASPLVRAPVLSADEMGMWIRRTFEGRDAVWLPWECVASVRTGETVHMGNDAEVYIVTTRPGTLYPGAPTAEYYAATTLRESPDEVLAALYRLSRGRVRIG
ncbi:hypothetical protein Afil01_02650 [Actinorhabdospora filicis]|uniref:PH domain-containing protein n=1 Tax=Actinorhabdospora filicis TaxID=1785913 RepID=A0A9W6W702_9ACTN|nr:hypothetical protein [Actinorhabdospora filicis]GLZ75458.1 hypothetical protein Afil01_02650 [Actinorhabdospora filicis]